MNERICADCVRAYPIPCPDCYRALHGRNWWRTWRNTDGITGAMVEIVTWLAVITGVLTALTWVLRGTAWLLERVA